VSLLKFLHVLLGWTGFIILSIVILVAPWLFGAWEMWWFWPFACAIFFATFLLGLRFVVLGMTSGRRKQTEGSPIDLAESEEERNGRSAYGFALPPSLKDSGVARLVVFSFLPFLVYGGLRAFQAEVFMDAERSFLLFLTPLLVGLNIAFGFNLKQRQWLFDLILADLCLLGLYGVINHLITGSTIVLWRDAFGQYAGRATGTYFCPDHFSGVLEICFCLAMAILTACDSSRTRKVCGAIAMGIALAGIAMSKSRGGGLTIVVVFAAVMVWCFGQSRPLRRWYLKLCWLAPAIIAAVVFWNSGNAYVSRFQKYPLWAGLRHKNVEQVCAEASQKIRTTSRGRMIGGAIRAWQSEPVWGIGPGMHQHLWRHFAATLDGDKEAGIWPTLPNFHFHSYEVHSDWVQLLEEYGLVGLGLFLLFGFVLFTVLLAGVRRESRSRRKVGWEDVAGEDHSMLLAAVLVCVCMAFHSLGDFNLQMPATVWLLGAVVALGVSHVSCSGKRTEEPEERSAE